MYELDFFGLINGAGVEWMAWLITVLSFSTIMMGLIWPLVEKLFMKWDVEELAAACLEIDAETMEEVANQIIGLEKQETALLWHISPGREKDWINMAWKGLVPIVRRRELLEEQLDHLWSTPILLT